MFCASTFLQRDNGHFGSNNKAPMLNHGKTGRFIKQLFAIDGQCFDKILGTGFEIE
jgi:hypothetical protein